MKLVRGDGQSIELRIAGYEFPEMETEAYDSNWLVVEGFVAHTRGAWRFRDACLLTYEVADLADWLESIARDETIPSECGFIEPVLEFRALVFDGYPVLRIYFELESRPEWAASDGAGKGDLWLELPLGEIDLVCAATELRRQLASYPQRAVH